MILPGILGEIAEIAGEQAALAIARERGGTQIYLPAFPDQAHWLSQLVGHDVAVAIADKMACGIGIRLDVPSGPTSPVARKRAHVDWLIGEGRSEREIALATGYNIRSVRRRRAQLRKLAEEGDTRAASHQRNPAALPPMPSSGANSPAARVSPPVHARQYGRA